MNKTSKPRSEVSKLEIISTQKQLATIYLAGNFRVAGDRYVTWFTMTANIKFKKNCKKLSERICF